MLVEKSNGENMGRYNKANTGDLVNDWFSNAPSFMSAANRMVNAQTEMEFLVFLEKAISIDKRSTCLYLKKHMEQLPENYRAVALSHLPDYL